MQLNTARRYDRLAGAGTLGCCTSHSHVSNNLRAGSPSSLWPPTRLYRIQIILKTAVSVPELELTGIKLS